jgi:uncharacterized protein (DUF1330 family)
MGSVELNPERVQELLDGADDAPIVMINLLRYRSRAVYPEGSAAEPCTGREAYGRYGAAVIQLISASGGRVLWMGSVQATVIAPDGEQWDDAILVEYPSRKAFVEMVSKPEYLAAAAHRTAALEDSRLIATTAGAYPL